MYRDMNKGPIRGYSSWWSPGLPGSWLLPSRWNSWTPAELCPLAVFLLPLTFRVMWYIGLFNQVRSFIYSVRNQGCLEPSVCHKSTFLVGAADTVTPSWSPTHRMKDNSSCSTHCPLTQILGENGYGNTGFPHREERLVDRLADLTPAGTYCLIPGREVSQSRILQLCLQLQDRWRILKKCFKEAKYRSFPIPSYTLDKLTLTYCLPPLVSS